MIEVIDFGLQDYETILNLQQSLFNNLVENKKTGRQQQEYIMIGEHYPVITMGRRANPNNLLTSQENLKQNHIDFYKIGRGGDFTYHCPGQIIVYPLLDLEKHKLSVKDYVDRLEKSVIEFLKYYNVDSDRIEGSTGVWIGKSTSRERKICAIGIKCTRFCTMHGIAINIKNDLKGFTLINPCGFTDRGVTSLQAELIEHGYSNLDIDMNAAKERLLFYLKKHLFRD